MTEISILIQHHAGPTGSILLVKDAEGNWSFPKGVQRTNETEPEAAERIAWENLGMKITVGKRTLQGHKKPTDGSVEHLYCGNITHNTHTKCNYHNYYEAVDKWQTEPVAALCSEYIWVHPMDLESIEYAGDDVNFMAKYGPWINGRVVPDVRMY